MNDNEIITSRENAKLKLARSVRDGREPGLIFVEGKRLARELLESDLVVNRVLISTEVAISDKLSDLGELLQSKRVNAVKVAANLFSSISDTENSQGIILLAEKPKKNLASFLEPGNSNRPVVLLHKVNNPANLGAAARTAEAAEVAGIITTVGSADPFSPKALRASMGSAFRLPIVEGIDFQAAIDWASEKKLITTAADIGGSSSYSQTDWTSPRLLIFGSEAHGLNDEELALMDETVTIPMNERVESLNLAVSAGIVLFEAKRQRDQV